VIAAINLDRLAQARTAIPRLVELGRALLARNPQARIGHQVPNCLSGKHQSMALTQLLARKRRPEVRIAFTDDGQCMVG
jgi:hypothetical protein